MNEPMKKVYKVCLVSNDKWLSACMNPNFPEEFRAVYKLGETTFPTVPNSKLFAFERCRDAEEFADSMLTEADDWVVLECETPEFEIPNLLYCPRAGMVKEFWTIWNMQGRILDAFKVGRLPQGTVWCPSLTPKRIIREVNYEEAYA